MKRTLHIKKGVNKSLTTLIIVVIAAIGAAVLAFSQAATPDASLTLNSASTTVTNGNNFTIALYEDSGSQAVNSFSIGLAYDNSKVDFVSVSTAGSPLASGGCPESLNSSNKVYVTCFISPQASVTSVTGKQLLANVTFKAKATGTANFGYLKESAERSAVFLAGTGENIWNSSTSGTIFTISGATTTPPPTSGGGTSGGTSGGTTGGTSGGTKQTTTTSPTTKTTPKTTAAATPTTTTPAANSESTTPTAALQDTNGIVAITIKDAAGKLAPGIAVTLGDQTVITDGTGTANFLGVEPGRYTVSASGDAGSASKNITVKAAADSGPIESQSFEITLQKSTAPMLYVGVAVAVALALILAILTKKWLKGRKRTTPKSTGSVVVNGQNVIAPSAPDDEATVPEPTLDTVPTAADVRSLKEKMGVSDNDTLEDIEKKVAPQKSKK